MWKTINYCGQTSSEACTMAANTITLLITLSDSQRIRKKKLLYRFYCFAGKTFRNKVTKEKSSSWYWHITDFTEFLPRPHPCYNVSLIPCGWREKPHRHNKIFLDICHQLLPKRVNDHTNKARSHQSRPVTTILSSRGDRRFFHKNAVYVRSNSALVWY